MFLSAYNLFASNTCTLSCTQLRRSNMQLHTVLIELQLIVARFVLPFYICTPSVFRMFLKYLRVLVFWSILSFVHHYSHTCLFRIFFFFCWLRYSMYLLEFICVVCIVYTLFFVTLEYVAFELSISLILILMILLHIYPIGHYNP